MSEKFINFAEKADPRIAIAVVGLFAMATVFACILSVLVFMRQHAVQEKLQSCQNAVEGQLQTLRGDVEVLSNTIKSNEKVLKDEDFAQELENLAKDNSGMVTLTPTLKNPSHFFTTNQVQELLKKSGVKLSE